MYNYPFSSEKQRALFPPPAISRSPSISTAATPIDEQELAAARSVLRSVISSTRSSPRASFFIPEDAAVPPLPEVRLESRETQTDAASGQVSLEGLVRAAGMSLASFATEVKTLERRVDSQHHEVLNAIRELKNRRP